MSASLDRLLGILDVEPIEVNIFRGTSAEESRQRLFGGQVAGQALVAAARTVDTGFVHSLHAYFLRPGDPQHPILYEVDRIRDGRSFTTRRVVAIQHGRAIFNLQASFQAEEDGIAYQLPMPDVPPPEDVPDTSTRLEPFKELLGDWYTRPRPIEQRYVGPVPMERHGPLPGTQYVWLRAAGRLPDDPVVHACLVTYASDMALLDTALLPHGISWTDHNIQMASLDHAMWFHRRFRADEWLLYAQEVVSTAHSRGLVRGSIFTQDGRMVVSIVQEGLIRIIK